MEAPAQYMSAPSARLLPAHDAPEARLEEGRHLGLAEPVLVPVAPDVAYVVDDATVARHEHLDGQRQ